MKVKFGSSLNTYLFVVPVLFILIIYFCVGIWLHFSGAADLLKDFHSAQLVTMLSDKKTGVELWLETRRKSLEDIAGSPVIASSIQVLSEGRAVNNNADEEAGAEEKRIEKMSSQQLQKLTKYLADFSQFRSISLLSNDGRFIWSTNYDLIGTELPDYQVFRSISPGNRAVFSGRITAKGSIREILISAPVSLAGKESKMIVVGQLNLADLAASLKVEKGFYETGGVAVIDSEGKVLASRDMTDPGKIRYNVPPGGTEGVEYRDGLFFIISPLKFEGLRIIATLDAVEASKPLSPFMNLYLIFAGSILVIIVIQVLLIAPRFIDRPFDKLLKAMQSVSEGDLKSINIRKGFVGELRMLSEGFSGMVVGLSRRKPARERMAAGDTFDRSKVLFAEVLIVEVKVRLEGIRRHLEEFVAAHPGAGKEIPGIAIAVKGLMDTIDSLNALIRFKDGSVKPVMKKCDLPALLLEAEEECRRLIGAKEIELIIDIHSNLEEAAINTDQKALKMLVSALLRHAIKVTEVGTITLLASHEAKGGVKYLELALSDTGSGVDRQSIEWVLKEDTFPSQHLDLGIAREFTDMLGGKIAIDSLQDRGSLVTVLIPLKGGMPKNAGKNNRKDGCVLMAENIQNLPVRGIGTCLQTLVLSPLRHHNDSAVSVLLPGVR
jgi:signal transduction histidine kinase